VTSSPPNTPRVTYARRLGLFSGVMMVIGGIIGSGIFRNPAVVPQFVKTAPLTLGVWVLGGAVAMIGAFIFSELGARRPAAGGGYVYLRDAYGPLPAFLYAWTLLLVMATGAIAAVATTFANYVIALTGADPRFTLPLAIGAIALLSAINYVGVAPGAVTQNIFTTLKLGALAALILAGLLLPVGGPPPPSPPAPDTLVLAVGAALVPVLFSYGGWQQTNFIAGEIRDPERNLPRAILIGVAAVVAIYLLANVTYLRTLGAAGLAASTAPAADAMERLVGPRGTTFIAAGIAISTFGFLNLVILVSPRVYQTMADDGLFFPALARLHPRWRTPATAIVLQAVWAILLTTTGTYEALTAYVVFGDWIFFGLNGAALLVLRARDRRAGAPEPSYRMPAAPLLVPLFVAAAAYVVAGSIASNPGNAARGTLLILLGIPVFRYWRNRLGAPARD
jgi:APA family basic amino acid/polyamine antiporter